MNALVFQPGPRTVRYSGHSDNNDAPFLVGAVDRGGIRSAPDTLSRIASDFRAALRAAVGESAGLPTNSGETANTTRTACAAPDVIAVRVAYGGSTLRRAARVTPAVIGKIEKLAVYAPLHVPAVVSLIRASERAFSNTPIVLVFDTAFFADLPAMEAHYALDASLSRQMQLRRYGYQGILHQAACAHTMRELQDTKARILSVCLEPRPEVAAVSGGHPVMVTGGATPLEGLPGERSCGDLDPSIVLTLARDKGWGPEQTNTVLTQQSGLLGLTGKRATLKDVFTSDDPAVDLAREVFRYRVLLASGAGMATMGGLDTIVFSGRDHAVSKNLGPWLASRLTLNRSADTREIPWTVLTKPVDRVIADVAREVVRGRCKAVKT